MKIRESFPSLVSQIVCNTKALFVVVEGFLEVLKTDMSVSKIAICNCLTNFVSSSISNTKLLAMVINGFFEIPETVKSTAKTTIRLAF